MELRTANTIRYISPLREGGSLPALVEADDGFKYVCKFLGSGHGTKALIAELLGGEIARLLGFRVPELVFLKLDEAFGRSEGDEEIQDLLKASTGLNLGLHFLSGALTFDRVTVDVDPQTASKLVWLDAFITNVDRTVKNSNMLMWHRELWLIDHGASLIFHHRWENRERAVLNPFSFIKEHILLYKAKHLEETDKFSKEILTDDKLKELVELIPDEWLNWQETSETPEQIRQAYYSYLTARRSDSYTFLNEALNARKKLI